MSAKKIVLVVLVVGLMLAAGRSITYALPSMGTEQVAQSLSAAAGAGSQLIGSNFTIANDSSLTETNPAVAYNPDREEYLVVWYNDRAGNDDIQAQRVSKNGALVGNPFYIAAGAGVDRRFPDVAYNSRRNEYLVVWEHLGSSGPEIHAVPVSATGGVDLSKQVVIATTSPSSAPYRPAVAYAYTSDKYLVVWYDEGVGFSSIWGQVLSSDGALNGSNFLISEDPGGHERYDPDVAYCRTRNEFLVVWRQLATPSDGDIYARRVTGDGNPLSPDSITISVLLYDETAPAVAALPLKNNEGDYLIVWETNTGSDTDIYDLTVHVASDGTVSLGSLLPQIVYDDSENESVPAVAGNESNDQYLVTWKQHYKVDLGGGLFLEFDGIAGKTVSSDGHLVSGTSTDPGVWIGGMDADNSAVAAGPLGDFLVAFDDASFLSSRGIYGQLWGNRIYLPLVTRNKH